MTLTGVSISSAGPGAMPPGYGAYINDPLSPAAPQIDTPYDLLTTNSLRDGTSFDIRIDDLRQFTIGKWQVGTTLNAYANAGNRDTARYWGSAPPIFDNPVQQQHFVPALLGVTSLVALHPGAHTQLTLGAIPTLWFSTMTMNGIPETNAGFTGAAIAPFAPALVLQTGADLKLGINQSQRFEVNILRLPQDAPYHTYAFGAHGDARIGPLQIGIESVQEWNAGSRRGLEELPTPVDWQAQHFVGPQRETMLALSTVLSSGVTRLELNLGRSLYDPDTTHTLFTTTARGAARRLDLQSTIKGFNLEAFGVSTDPTYDPFILNYPLFGDQLNSPWALPGPVYNSFYDLRDMTRYTSNQRTLGLIASHDFWGGTATMTLTRSIQANLTRTQDESAVGFIEPFYSFPSDPNDLVLGTNSSAILQLQHLQFGKIAFSATYENFRYTRPTLPLYPADNLGYGQQYLSLQAALNVQRWTLTPTFNLSRLDGAWFSPNANLHIRQPQFSLSAMRRAGAGSLTLSASAWNYTDPNRPEAFTRVLLFDRYTAPLKF